MMTCGIFRHSRRLAAAIIAALALGAALVGTSPPAVATPSEDSAQILIDRAKVAVESMVSAPGQASLRALIPQARAVLVVPSLMRGAFFFGASGGSGVLLARNPSTGEWGYPAFYTLGGISFGLQFGAQDSEAILVIMTQGALDAVLDHQVKLGGDLSVALGPVGEGVGASATTNAEVDIYAYSRARGLFLGGAFEGSVIAKRDDWNAQFYGPDATSQDIVMGGKFANKGADGLRTALTGDNRPAAQQPGMR